MPNQSARFLNHRPPFIGEYAELLRKIPQGQGTSRSELNGFSFSQFAACGLLFLGQVKLKMNFNFAKKGRGRN